MFSSLYHLEEQVYHRLDRRGYDPIPQQRHQPVADSHHHQQYFQQQYAGPQHNFEPVYDQLNTQQPRMPYRTHDSTMRGVGPQQDWAPPIRAHAGTRAG